MPVIGILLIAAGIWVVYCGMRGINPGETAVEVIRDPSNASKTIVTKTLAANLKYGELFTQAANFVPSSVSEALPGGAPKGLNPWLAFGVSDNWAAHIKRGSRGGTDYKLPSGTPVVTPLSGTVQNFPNAGAAGNQVVVTFADGWKMYLMHLSKFARANGDKVGAFSIVGYSGGKAGAPGAGSSTGAHLHVHMVSPSGVMTPFESYIAGKSPSGSGGGM